MPPFGPKSVINDSMVGYRRQKYLVVWFLVILALIALFYYYFTFDSKTGGPLKNLTLILATTTTRTSSKGDGNWLQPYSNAVQFDSVWFKKNCLEALTDSEGIGNLGKLVNAWKNALSTDCRNLYNKFSDIYFVRDRTAPLRIPDSFLPKVLKWLGGKQELVKEAYLQHITSVDNKYTQESTVFNPLRGKRPGAGGGASEETKRYVAELVQSSAKDCDFCNHKTNTAQDPFERVESKYSVSVSNTFKVEKFHGLILLKHHNPLEVNEVMLLDGMDTAQKWFYRAHLYDQQYTVPHIYWDTLPRASASQVHPHFHVSLADHYYGRWAHFQAAAKEYAAKHNGENYFTALNQIYSALGLAAQHGSATVVAYLTPSASHEIMLFSKEPSKHLFQLLFYCVAALRNDMELYAISAGMVFPKLIPSAHGSDLPAIIRLVYRGPAEAMRADIDSLQLFGTGNVNVDPFSVISSIKNSIAKRKEPL